MLLHTRTPCPGHTASRGTPTSVNDTVSLTVRQFSPLLCGKIVLEQCGIFLFIVGIKLLFSSVER